MSNEQLLREALNKSLAALLGSSPTQTGFLPVAKADIQQHLDAIDTARKALAQPAEGGEAVECGVVSGYSDDGKYLTVTTTPASPAVRVGQMLYTAPPAEGGAVVCETCGGNGRIVCGSGARGWPPRMRTEPCPECNGTGKRTTPPASLPAEGGEVVRDSDRQLLSFYGVATLHALIDAQERHITKLQAKFPRDNQPAFTQVREG